MYFVIHKEQKGVEQKMRKEEKNFLLSCTLSKEEADLLFNSIDYYATSSILFNNKDTKTSKKCRRLWIFLNKNCVEYKEEQE